MKNLAALFFGLIAMASLFAHPASASEIKVAAAADLKFALDEIIKNYETLHPKDKVEAVYGASGKFVTQIKEGAPFDLFLSADSEKAEDLVQAQKSVAGKFQYAQGHLALWVRNESKVQLDSGLKCLQANDIHKIAIANAVTAPYGKAAEAALKKTGLMEKVMSKLVIGENISQTAQFVESGAADAGLIAKSLAMSPALKKEGRFIDVDPTLYDPLVQAGVLIKGAHQTAAESFKEYFLSADGARVLTAYGLTAMK